MTGKRSITGYVMRFHEYTSPPAPCPLPPAPLPPAPRPPYLFVFVVLRILHYTPCFFTEKRRSYQAVELLRDLLRDYRGPENSEDKDAAQAQAVAVQAVAAVGTRASSSAEDGELARVARGRLEWLIQRLRGLLSGELAGALRSADPMSAAGGGWGGSGGHGAGEAGGGERGKTGGRLSEADEAGRKRALVRVKVGK